MGDKDLLTRFFLALPLKKLSGNQAFDLVCDGLMLALVFVASLIDMGPNKPILMGTLIFCAVVFLAWSFKSNL